MKKEQSCLACGNNPIPHFPAKINSHLAALGSPLIIFIKGPWGRLFERAADKLIWLFIMIARGLRIFRFNDDIQKNVGGRAQVIWEEAKRRGIVMRQIVVGKIHTDGYEATFPNGHRIYFMGLPIPKKLIYRSDVYQWIDNKAQLKKRLQRAHIPIPQGGQAVSLSRARSLFNRIRKPVITKPTAGSRGRHTTTNINTLDELRQGFKTARQIAREVMVEEHLVGSVYRGTIVNGALRGVLRGDPPRITGDGISTITELIAAKNAAAKLPVKPFIITPLTESFLGRAGYRLSSVLPKGKTIDLTEKIGVSYGGYSAEELPICHPKTKEILEAAGRAINFPVMGFDFIIEDITKDPDTQRWGIIECNSVPFIDLHHHPASGTPINVAAAVWDLWI